MEGKRKKTAFSYRIFGISPYRFTQISILGTHWMQNLILHLTHTYTSYFEVTTTLKNENFKKKNIILKYVFLLKFSFLGVVGT